MVNVFPSLFHVTVVAGEPVEVQVRIGKDVELEDPKVKAKMTGETGEEMLL